MVLKLTCAVQNYDWGITGDSEVSSLGALNTGEASDPSKPYAELWMGTHPSGPSVVAATGTGLKETIAKDAATHLGAKTLERFGDDLPFLTKVLSVSKALSIQAHPDKTLAAKLHADRPNVYKDDNHKPEMTLAVTEFEALCGFVAPKELAKNLENVPELRAVVGEATAAGFIAAAASSVVSSNPEAKSELAALFTALMTADAAAVATQVGALVARLSQAQAADASSIAPTDALAVRLNQQYPRDVGVLCAYVLNYITLKPGQCIYLAANEPHAYLSGECVECMATSDNVVRAGLTAKLRDTAILCDMLTYAAGMPEILEGEALDATTRRYQPPFDEFQLEVGEGRGDGDDDEPPRTKKNNIIKSNPIPRDRFVNSNFTPFLSPLFVFITRASDDGVVLFFPYQEVLEVGAGAAYRVAASPGPCVFLVQGGGGSVGGEEAGRGAVVYAAAGEEVEVRAGDEGCKLYRAMINARVFEV